MTGSSTVCAPTSAGGFSPVAEGVMLAALGTALFTPIFAAGKIVDGAVPAIAVVAMRYLGGVGTVLAVAAARGASARALRSDAPWLHATRAAFGVGGGACAIQAATMIPVAEATAIGLVKGVLIVILAGALLRERIPLSRWLAAGLCALGGLWVVAPSLGGFGDAPSPRALAGAGFAFAGALLIALEALLVKIVARREPALTVLLQVNAFGALLAAPVGLAAAAASGADATLVAAMLLLGPLAILGQYCNVLAYRRADASTVGPVSYLSILFSALLGLVAFGEVPAATTALGGALIVVGGVWLARSR